MTGQRAISIGKKPVRCEITGVITDRFPTFSQRQLSKSQIRINPRQSRAPRRFIAIEAVIVLLVVVMVPPRHLCYSMFCTCSRIWSITTLSARPALVMSGAFALEHSVFASRLNSCARKSNCRPTAPPCA